MEKKIKDYSKDIRLLFNFASPLPFMNVFNIKPLTEKTYEELKEVGKKLTNKYVVDILTFIYVFKKLNIYQLALLTKISYSAIHRHVNNLIDMGILKCEETVIDRKPSKVVSLKVDNINYSEWLKGLLDNRTKLEKFYKETKETENKNITGIIEHNKKYMKNN